MRNIAERCRGLGPGLWGHGEGTREFDLKWDERIDLRKAPPLRSGAGYKVLNEIAWWSCVDVVFAGRL